VSDSRIIEHGQRATQASPDEERSSIKQRTEHSGVDAMDQNRRPSVYLEERCENLAQVLEFFLGPHRGQSPAIDEMLVVFLSQLGFWEWELDNLIYAFSTFDERSQAWEHENGLGMANALRTQGILVRFSAVKNLKAKRQARAGRRREVFAPVEHLNRLIQRWNALLDLCEERVLVDIEEREEAVELGAQLLPDLSKFRKSPLPEPAGGDDST
jgi:hypothetical protein